MMNLAELTNEVNGYTSPSRSATSDVPLHIHLSHQCPVMRAGLAAILSSYQGFRITAGEQAPTYFPDSCILITDYESGLAAARQVWPQQPGHTPCVLVLTDLDKEGDVRRAIESGVHGYLVQGCNADEIVACVRSLSQGRSYLSPMATRSIVNSLNRATLTKRENDVLQELATGAPDKMIARALGISNGTVKSHMKHLMSKLDATARTQVVVVAIGRGLLDRPKTDTPLGRLLPQGILRYPPP